MIFRVCYIKLYCCASCSKSVSFLENLVGNFGQSNPQGKIIKYKIDKSEKNTILKKLNYMNINKQSLFPGLDGFAESLSVLPKSPILEWDIPLHY